MIGIDLPGFGGSEPLPEGVAPTPANLAAAVCGFCAELGIGRPHVAGNSLGAWVGLEMAKAGGAVSVTALSPAGLWGKPLGPRRYDSHALAVRMRPLLSLALRSRRGRQAILRTTMAKPEQVPARIARAMVLGWVDAPGYEAANREMRADVFDPAASRRRSGDPGLGRARPTRIAAATAPVPARRPLPGPPGRRSHPDLGRPRPDRPRAARGKRGGRRRAVGSAERGPGTSEPPYRRFKGPTPIRKANGGGG